MHPAENSEDTPIDRTASCDVYLMCRDLDQANFNQARQGVIDSGQAYTMKFKNLPGNWSYEEISIGLPAGDFDWWRVLNIFVKNLNASGDKAKRLLGWQPRVDYPSGLAATLAWLREKDT